MGVKDQEEVSEKKRPLNYLDWKQVSLETGCPELRIPDKQIYGHSFEIPLTRYKRTFQTAKISANSRINTNKCLKPEAIVRFPAIL